MDIKKIHLPTDEYYPTKTDKKTIILHHTAGSHRADWTVATWDRDKTKGGKPLRVATQYVIGGKSTKDGNRDWDGVIVEALPVEMWAHHLGTKNSNNTLLNQQSIGIEICNYGPLTKSSNGEYFTYVNSRVPEEDVIFPVEIPCISDSHVEIRSSRRKISLRISEISAFYRTTLGIRISINSESSEGLTSLPGIGPKLAEAIVKERTKRGGFEKLSDIRSVRGIGTAVYREIEPYLTLN